MSAGLPQERAGAFRVSLQERVLGQLAEVVRRDAATLLLDRRRELVKHLQSIGPVALALVDPHQMIERCLPILARSGQLLEQPLGAIHESRAKVVEREGKRRLVAQPRTAVIPQPRMNRYRTIHLAAPPEEAPQGKLDLGHVAIGFGHASEDLRRMLETIVDQVIEPDVVVARETDGSGSADTPPEKPRSDANQDEGKREQERG